MQTTSAWAKKEREKKAVAEVKAAGKFIRGGAIQWQATRAAQDSSLTKRREARRKAASTVRGKARALRRSGDVAGAEKLIAMLREKRERLVPTVQAPDVLKARRSRRRSRKKTAALYERLCAGA